MSKTSPSTEWREARRQSARDAIVDAAWALVRHEGLAALTLRDLAKQANITTPTVYAYFDSKNAIYDAMFGHAATVFADHMNEPYDADDSGDPHKLIAEMMRRCVDFCTDDVARFQLLFQRTIPGFEPSPESYAPAVRSFEALRDRLASIGLTDACHVDMWTALTTGLVDQQISNDPGGDRWARLIDNFAEMFLVYCKPNRKPNRKPLTKGARP
jgi:AcrR family transcriptional regulator